MVPQKNGVFTNNGEFQWNLIIKPEASIRPNLKSGSNVPRFDARLFRDLNGKSYINPFTNKIGNSTMGTHIPLETNYMK